MSNKTCFVVMAIGNQHHNGQTITAEDLKARYDNLIKEAILKARPSIEVTRADEVSAMGTITTDIVQRIMYSDYIIADVSYPNPNVFYELGLRHACKPGTIIIKDKDAKVPFDIASLRYIEYENSTQGLKDLSNKLLQTFDNFDRDNNRPDNHFLEVAKLTSFKFPEFFKEDPLEVQFMMSLLQSPELIDLFSRQQRGEEVDSSEIMQSLSAHPNILKPVLKYLLQSGELNLLPK
ncbi:TPA: hypothetical protein ACFN8Z_001011 [Neisseria meningitidis]|uniref:hypothetical protein n=1 Tax=Neisseria meningitidis TaxID=487 RepID=UPI001EFE2F06|nr:hypothetical protein [Neisseria meningitidis]